jgi:hypothetical protein
VKREAGPGLYADRTRAWIEMVHEGISLPIIHRQLQHREPRYTYHYLSAAPDLLAHAARLLNDAQQVRS